MSGTLLSLASALIGGGALAALATYLTLRRQTSGQISTSDAATLWRSAEAMRRELRDEVISLRGKVEQLEDKVVELTVEIQALKDGLATDRGHS